MSFTFEFALNANQPIRVIVTNSEEIDAILSLPPSTVPLHRSIVEQAAPQHN